MGLAAQIQAGAGGPDAPGAGDRSRGRGASLPGANARRGRRIALVSAVRRRDLLILVPLTVIAAGLGFDLVAYLSGGIIWSYRYCIAAIPLDIALVGVILAGMQPRKIEGEAPSNEHAGAPTASTQAGARQGRTLHSAVLAAFAIVMIAPSLITTAAGMFNPRVGVEETRVLGYVFHNHPSAVDRGYAQNYQKSQDIASFLANLKLTDGDVVVDNSSPCIPLAIVVSPNPKIFVIPNDRDFQRILADPLTFHAHYILVPAGGGQGSLTATNRLYPALYGTGEGVGGQKFASPVHAFSGAGACPSFRLYRVTQHPDTVQ